ncbi:hypothetical protein, partial [Halomonas sp. PR-M31]|uniref:hypothetical protein n=1 Tax=Halomonas sp. PR-M31 TaxID=1471202 RepID=UPI0006503C53
MRTIVALIIFMASIQCLAAPGIIAQTPVIETVGVKPNIMLILDDSGSMRREETLNKGVERVRLHEDVKFDSTSHYLESFGVKKLFKYESSLWEFNYATKSEKIDDERMNEHQINAYMKLATCSGFNTLAYNENKTYSVPFGRDKLTSAEESALENL